MKDYNQKGWSKKCPVCSVNIPDKKFANHLKNMHPRFADISRNISSIYSKMNKLVSQKEAAKYFAENTTSDTGLWECHGCTSSISPENCIKHIKTQHPGLADLMQISHILSVKEKRAMKKEEKKKNKTNRFASAVEREKLFREKLGPDRRPSKDPFDLGLTVSGGAWGMGKKR